MYVKQNLLAKQLPSPEEIAGVEQRAGQLVPEVSHAERRSSEAWQGFVVALEAAETGGREWVATRSGLQATTAELKHLGVPVPAIFSPDGRDANYVELLGNWMRVAAFGTDASIERIWRARERDQQC